jgi:hypothetical protein
MSLEFVAQRHIKGYRVVPFRHRLVYKMDNDGYPLGSASELPSSATEDERMLFDRWGVQNFELHDAELDETLQFIVPKGEQTEEYRLFEASEGAFMEFAHLKCTKSSVISFANRYGLLHADQMLESLHGWFSSIRGFRRAVREWETARENCDYRAFCRFIERRIENLRLDFVRGNATGLQANVYLKPNAEGNQARLAIGPHDLHGALWLQLILAVDGAINLRSCVVCSRWFPIQVGKARVDRRYCSDACKMRAYRKRKAEGSGSDPALG